MVMGEGVGTGEAILANKQLGGGGGSGGGGGTCCPDTKTKFAREGIRRFGCFVSDTRFACHLYLGNPHPRHAPEHRACLLGLPFRYQYCARQNSCVWWELVELFRLLMSSFPLLIPVLRC